MGIGFLNLCWFDDSGWMSLCFGVALEASGKIYFDVNIH